MMQLALSFMLMTSAVYNVGTLKAKNPNDYVIQYVFQKPVYTDHLTHYEKMKLFK